jgi:hypothetical protein
MENVNKVAEEGVKQATNVASNVASNVTSNTTKIAQETTKELGKALNNLQTDTGALIGLIIVIVVALVTAIFIYYMVVEQVFNKKSAIIPETKQPVPCNALKVIPIQEMPRSGNGSRRTMTFWIYLNDMNKFSGQYKHVFHIGSDGESITSGSPYVFLDKNSNKMYIRYAKKSAREECLSSNLNNIANISDGHLSEYMKQGVVLDYIPMQRWVHVAVVVNDDVNGGSITTYLDSELAKVSTALDVDEQNVKTHQCSSHNNGLNNLLIDKTGDLVVGGNGQNGSSPGFSGLISKVTFFNYDLNQRDIYGNYSEGPIDGMFTSLGYGIRNPIYKL